MNHRFNPVTVHQATQDSAVLAGLIARTRDTSERLEAVRELIPSEMHAVVQAGPVEAGTWCLLVQGSAAAAKLRQLLPLMRARLKSGGWDDVALRIKVQARR